MIAPVVRDGAIGYGPVSQLSDLPVGWGDEQDAGSYRLRRRDDELVFGYASGAQSVKPVFFPARDLFWRAHREGDGFTVDEPPAAEGPFALLGVRSCDLSALGIHDTVLLGRGYVDASYAVRRTEAFVVAVACTDPAGCASAPRWGPGLARSRAGPGVRPGDDRILDDRRPPFPGGGRHRAGAEILGPSRGRVGDPGDITPHAPVATAIERMGRRMDTETASWSCCTRVRDARRREEVADPLPTCTNCTMVCPTCFCTDRPGHDRPDRGAPERWRALVCRTRARPQPPPRRRCGTPGDPRPLPTVDDPQTRHLDRPVRQLRPRGMRMAASTWCPSGIDITEEARGGATRPGVGGGRPPNGRCDHPSFRPRSRRARPRTGGRLRRSHVRVPTRGRAPLPRGRAGRPAAALAADRAVWSWRGGAGQGPGEPRAPPRAATCWAGSWLGTPYRWQVRRRTPSTRDRRLRTVYRPEGEAADDRGSLGLRRSPAALSRGAHRPRGSTRPGRGSSTSTAGHAPGQRHPSSRRGPGHRVRSVTRTFVVTRRRQETARHRHPLTLEPDGGGAQIRSRPGSSRCCTRTVSGRLAVSISGDPARHATTSSHTMRDVGAVSGPSTTHRSAPVLGVRGPSDRMGRATAIRPRRDDRGRRRGLAPLRPVILADLAARERYRRTSPSLVRRADAVRHAVRRSELS